MKIPQLCFGVLKANTTKRKKKITIKEKLLHENENIKK